MQGSELDRIRRSFMSAPLAFRPAHEAAFLLPLFFFYARVRRLKPITPVSPLKLQSAHPLRGATVDKTLKYKLRKISIHAPLAGCDVNQAGIEYKIIDFNPRTPCGVRQGEKER